MLKIAVPNKGRLSEASLELFHKAGLRVETSPDRKLFASALDNTVQILFLRAQDIPEFVQDGVAHLGITGADIIRETDKDVRELMDLRFGSCRLVVAVPEKSGWNDVKSVPDNVRVASSFPMLTRAHFEAAGKKVNVVEVSGATELTPSIGVADLIVDLTSSGSTLKMNGLREIGTILHSTARLIMSPDAFADDAIKTRTLLILDAIESVLAAKGKRYLMANVPRDALDEVTRILPGLSGPTVMDILSHPELIAVHAVVDESALPTIINGLKGLGATGMLVLPIERLVP